MEQSLAPRKSVVMEPTAKSLDKELVSLDLIYAILCPQIHLPFISVAI